MGKLADLFREIYGVDPHEYDIRCDCLACAIQRAEETEFGE